MMMMMAAAVFSLFESFNFVSSPLRMNQFYGAVPRILKLSFNILLVELTEVNDSSTISYCEMSRTTIDYTSLT